MRLTEEDLLRIIQSEGYSVFGESVPVDKSHFTSNPVTNQAVDKKPSSLEKRFINIWELIGGDSSYQRNFRFDLPDSRMELDFAWLDLHVGIEINGGQSLGKQSGHGNWNGLERDAIKQNRCVYKGWTLFWLTTSMMNKEHLEPIAQYIEVRKQGNN